jgi:hypothetical protein
MPDELVLAWQCERTGALPRAGGVLDQEPGQLRRMAIAHDAYRVWVEYMSIVPGTGAEWQRRNPGMWKIVEEIEGLNG